MHEQEESGKFLPAFFVDVVELGQVFPRGEWPLHMTYFPPIQTSFDAKLAPNLRRYLNPMPPFEATVGESDFFGPQFDIHVRRIEPSPQLLTVHRALVAALRHLPHNARYRMPYNPHISIDKDDTRLQTGDVFEVGGLSIIEKPAHSQTWQVIAKIGLKGEREAAV